MLNHPGELDLHSRDSQSTISQTAHSLDQDTTTLKIALILVGLIAKSRPYSIMQGLIKIDSLLISLEAPA